MEIAEGEYGGIPFTLYQNLGAAEWVIETEGKTYIVSAHDIIPEIWTNRKEERDGGEDMR